MVVVRITSRLFYTKSLLPSQSLTAHTVLKSTFDAVAEEATVPLVVWRLLARIIFPSLPCIQVEPHNYIPPMTEDVEP